MTNDIATGELAESLEKVLSGTIIEAMPVTVPNGGSKTLQPMRRMGVPGYSITNGYVLPYEEDGRLTGQQRYKIFAENFTNVAIIATGVRYTLDLIGSASLAFEPGEDSAAGDEIVEFFESVFDDMETPISRVLRRASMYKFYGFSVQEWTAKKRDDGRLGLADIEPRPQKTVERWDVDANGWVKGLIQRNPNTGQELYLPRDKLLYMTDDSLSDSPEGLGLFRHMIRGSAGLKRFEDLEHWGFETDLQGIPVGRAPLAALQKQVDDNAMSQAQMNQAVAIMQNFIANHIRGPKTGLMLDSMTYQTTDERQSPSTQRLWDMELLKSGGTSHAQIDVAIKRKTFELARLLGIEHLLIGSEGGGSLALHKSSTQRLHAMINSCLTEIVETMQRQLVRMLCTVNNIPDNLRPKLKAEKVAYRTIEEITGALSTMATAGAPMMPDDPAVGEVRDILGLSRPDIASQITLGLMGMPGVADDQIGDELDDDRTGEGKPKGRGKPAAKPSARSSQPADPRVALAELASYISGNQGAA